MRMQLLSPNTKMANDGVDAFTWPSQPSSLLRQPGLYPCDRSAAEPAHLRWLVLATFMPGLAFGLAGRWSDFLIWVGTAAILGWAIAVLANKRPKSRS